MYYIACIVADFTAEDLFRWVSPCALDYNSFNFSHFRIRCIKKHLNLLIRKRSVILTNNRFFKTKKCNISIQSLHGRVNDMPCSQITYAKIKDYTFHKTSDLSTCTSLFVLFLLDQRYQGFFVRGKCINTHIRSWTTDILFSTKENKNHKNIRWIS